MEEYSVTLVSLKSDLESIMNIKVVESEILDEIVLSIYINNKEVSFSDENYLPA